MIVNVEHEKDTEFKETFESVSDFIKRTNETLNGIEKDNELKSNELGRCGNLQDAIQTWLDWEYKVIISK